ncbi:MAG: hypothetical protein MJ252_02350 [archaeon]|nr:hypothetical protein [archaeon]
MITSEMLNSDDSYNNSYHSFFSYNDNSVNQNIPQFNNNSQCYGSPSKRPNNYINNNIVPTTQYYSPIVRSSQYINNGNPPMYNQNVPYYSCNTSTNIFPFYDESVPYSSDSVVNNLSTDITNDYPSLEDL